PQNQGSNDHVQAEEAADPAGEELVNEQTKIQAMAAQEGNQLGVRQHHARDAEIEVQAAGLHPSPPRKEAPVSDALRKRRIGTGTTVRSCPGSSARRRRRILQPPSRE